MIKISVEERRKKIKEIYDEMYPKIPCFSDLGHQFGVSERMIRKDVIKLGLPLHSTFQRPNFLDLIKPPNVRDYSKDVIEVESKTAIVSADYHLPFYDADLVNKLLKMARNSIFGKIPLHIIGGDLLDEYVFSFWDRRDVSLTWSKELEIASNICKKLFGAFDKTIVLPGNHTQRILRMASFQLTFRNVMDMLGIPLDNVILSDLDYCVLNKKWRITHPKSFSKTPLYVANVIAQQHHQNVIMQHGHFLNMGVDKSGHWIIADGGGMFAEKFFDYRMREDSTYGMWEPGFFVINNNKPYMFNNRFTDWDFWIKEEENDGR